MKEYKNCEECGGSGKGKKMQDLDRYHQCPKCAGRGKYYDITAVTDLMPEVMYKRQLAVMNKITG